MKNRKFKKIIFLILSIILLFSLIGCNKKQNSSEYFFEITINSYIEASKTEAIEGVVTPENSAYSYNVTGDLFKCYVYFIGTIYQYLDGRKVINKTIIFGNIYPNGEENKEYCDATYSYEIENELGQKENFELKRPGYAPEVLLPNETYNSRYYNYYLQEKSGKHIIKLTTQKYEKYGIDKGEYEFTLNVVNDNSRKDAKIEIQNYNECILEQSILNGCDAYTVYKNKDILYRVKDKVTNDEIYNYKFNGSAIKLGAFGLYNFIIPSLSLKNEGIYYCKILINEFNGYKPIEYYFYLIVV